MMALILFTLFAVAAVASLIVLADSGLRAVDAWHRLRGELQALSGLHAVALTKRTVPARARIVRLKRNETFYTFSRAAA
ncbi:MAG: hypothetical protein ACK4GD_02610 [Sphingomonadaceae bacterium]